MFGGSCAGRTGSAAPLAAGTPAATIVSSVNGLSAVMAISTCAGRADSCGPSRGESASSGGSGSDDIEVVNCGSRRHDETLLVAPFHVEAGLLRELLEVSCGGRRRVLALLVAPLGVSFHDVRGGFRFLGTCAGRAGTCGPL
jgi:hypothetical protein